MLEATFGIFNTAAILVTVAAILGYLNHRFIGLPHTIGLTIMGAVASVIVAGVDAFTDILNLRETFNLFLQHFDFSDSLLDGMLSFLLFAGALTVNLDDLLKGRWAVAISATVGVLISTVIVGAGFWAITQLVGLPLPLIWCFVFGALISPTDPVAVLGIVRTANVDAALQARITGESLFNDGVGVVVFAILLATAVGETEFSIASAAELFLIEAGGGALLGFLLGWLGTLAMRGIDEHNIEILISLAIVMGGYALASALHISGPVAMAIAGLLIGNHGVNTAMSDATARHLLDFWSLVDELLNSVLFLLIGLEALALLGSLSEISAGLLAIPLVLIARAVSISGPGLAMGKLAPFRDGTYPFLIWGGLRGGISIALALSLPVGAERDELLTATYVVVIFSVIVQGLTVGKVARHFGADRAA